MFMFRTETKEQITEERLKFVQSKLNVRLNKFYSLKQSLISSSTFFSQCISRHSSRYYYRHPRSPRTLSNIIFHVPGNPRVAFLIYLHRVAKTISSTLRLYLRPLHMPESRRNPAHDPRPLWLCRKNFRRTAHRLKSRTLSLQIPEDLLQRTRHPRPAPLTTMGVPASARHPLPGAFSTAPAVGAQERARAPPREHQARPNIRPRQGEYH